jgi:hypothetical protein
MKTKFVYENRFTLSSEVNNKKHFFNHGLSQSMFFLYEKKQNRFSHGISIAQHISRFQAVNNIQLPSHNIISTCTTATFSQQS